MTTVRIDLINARVVEKIIAADATEMAFIAAALSKDIYRLVDMRQRLTVDRAHIIDQQLDTITALMRPLLHSSGYLPWGGGLIAAYAHVGKELTAMREAVEAASADNTGGLFTSVADAVKAGVSRVSKRLARVRQSSRKRAIRAIGDLVIAAKPGLETLGTPIGAGGELEHARVAQVRNHLVGSAVWLHNARFRGHAQYVESRKQPNATGLGSYVEIIASLEVGTVAIVKVPSASHSPTYVVCARGMNVLSAGVNSAPGAAGSVFASNDPYTASIKVAMFAEVPAGANLMLVGHSQGGAALANLAGDKELNGKNGKYNITHVATVGSPSDSKKIANKTKVLHIENVHDMVPYLDGDLGNGGEKYTFNGRKKDSHGVSMYAKEIDRKEFITSGEYKLFSRGTHRYFPGAEAKKSTVTTYRLYQYDYLTGTTS